MLSHWAPLFPTMPGDACICCTQSNTVGGDIRRVSLQTTNTKERGTRCTACSRLLQFRVSLQRCGTHPRTVKSSLLQCMFWFFLVLETPTSIRLAFQPQRQLYTVMFWFNVRVSRWNCGPRTPFQANSGSDGKLYPSTARLRSRSSNAPGFCVKAPQD